MVSDLMPWLIAWAIVTTVVIALALYRTGLAWHDIPGVHLSGDPGIPERQKETARKLNMVDLLGKALTVVSAVLILVIAGMWGYYQYMKAYEVVGH